MMKEKWNKKTILRELSHSHSVPSGFLEDPVKSFCISVYPEIL